MAEAKLDLREEYAKIARRLETVLRAQAPSESIAKKIQVNSDSNGMYIVMDSEVGVWLYTGTGNETAKGSMNTGGQLTQNLLDALDGNDPNPNPGKGIGGIKPRYFLNFTQSVKAMIADNLSMAYAKAINDIIAEQI